jgi:hypothetical protein
LRFEEDKRGEPDARVEVAHQPGGLMVSQGSR